MPEAFAPDPEPKRRTQARNWRKRCECDPGAPCHVGQKAQAATTTRLWGAPRGATWPATTR
eukprot:4187775-Pyramimonas_sp.AAC.1